jgi:hypothetical protein
MAQWLRRLWRLIRRPLRAVFAVAFRAVLKVLRAWLLWREAWSACTPIHNNRPEEAMDDERLNGLIAFLHAYHGGSFVNNAIQRDELLAVLEELRTLRHHRQDSELVVKI